MSGRLRFTIYHGLVASLTLHAALGLPFVLHSLEPPLEEAPKLMIELQGAIADMQVDQKLQQESTGTEQPQQAAVPTPPPAQEAKPTPPPPEPPPEVTEPPPQVELASPPPPPPTPVQNAAPPEKTEAATPNKAGNAGVNDIVGAELQQTAQRIKTPDEIEEELIRDYVKVLAKQVNARLRDEDIKASVIVSFRILTDGQLRPETLKIVRSSGRSKLDASALRTIRASVPFPSPPKEMTVAFTVDFDQRK